MKQSVETFSGPRLANFTLFFSACMKIQDLQGLNNKSHISGFFSASMGLRVRHGTDGETDRRTDRRTDDVHQCLMPHPMRTYGSIINIEW